MLPICCASETAALDSRDAALAETLVFGCLRYQSQLDFLIAHFAGRPQPKLDLEVRIALRMGIFQLRYLDRIPAHAAVAESVELVKSARKRSAAGFVNAVLRKVNRAPVRWPDRATELSVPAWMLERWERHYGPRRRPRHRRSRAGGTRGLYQSGDRARQQDIGAQSIVPLLEIEPGMTVLDLCAAPGNKTAQALAAGGRVTACDRYLRRLAEVPAEAARVVLDAAEPLPFCHPVRVRPHPDRRPVFRHRHPGAEILKSNGACSRQTYSVFQARQRKMIERALPHLRPGGRWSTPPAPWNRKKMRRVSSKALR